MKKKFVIKWMAGMLAVGMTLSMGACGQDKGNNSGDPNRKESAGIVSPKRFCIERYSVLDDKMFILYRISIFYL